MTMVIALIKNPVLQVLTKVDDGILKVSFASWVVTLSTSLMILDFLGISHSEVSHVVGATLLTYFEICISVYLTNIFSWNSTLSVETINVLGNDML